VTRIRCPRLQLITRVRLPWLHFLTRTCHPEDHRVIAGRVVDTHIYSIIMDVLVGLRPRNHLERWLQCASLNGLNVLHALGIFQRVVAGRVGAGRRREDQTS
jgi:hypothetical protein